MIIGRCSSVVWMFSPRIGLSERCIQYPSLLTRMEFAFGQYADSAHGDMLHCISLNCLACHKMDNHHMTCNSCDITDLKFAAGQCWPQVIAAGLEPAASRMRRLRPWPGLKCQPASAGPSAQWDRGQGVFICGSRPAHQPDPQKAGPQQQQHRQVCLHAWLLACGFACLGVCIPGMQHPRFCMACIHALSAHLWLCRKALGTKIACGQRCCLVGKCHHALSWA